MCRHTVTMVVIQTNTLETPHLPGLPDVLKALQSSPNRTLLRAGEHGSNYLWPCTQHWLTKSSCMRPGLEDVPPLRYAVLPGSHIHGHESLGSGMIDSDAGKGRRAENAGAPGGQNTRGEAHGTGTLKYSNTHVSVRNIVQYRH